MIKLKLEKESYNLPENWGEVILEQFQAISKIKYESKLKYAVDVLCSLTGLSEEIILAIEKGQISKIVETLQFIYSQKFSEKVNQTFMIGDDEYHLKDFGTLTLGETISIETLIEKYNNNLIQAADRILAVLYQKKGETFDASILEDRAKLFRENLNVETIYGVIFFLLNIEKEYLKLMEAFSEKQKKIQMMRGLSPLKRLYHSVKDGIGLAWSRGWQWAILQNLKRSINKTTSRVSTSSVTGKNEMKYNDNI